MQAGAVEAKAWLHKRSPSRRSAALCAEQYAAGCECRLAAARATGCGCRLLPCHKQRSNAAQMKPFRAGVQRCHAERVQLAANAGCCGDTESMAAQTEPFKAECSAFMLSEMQLRANAGCCHASNRLRMQAVAVIRTAKHCIANEALQGRVQCLQ